MQRRAILILGVLILVLAAAAGGLWAYDFVQGDTEAASGPIAAAPIVVNTTLPTSAGIQTNAPTENAAAQGSDPAIFQILPGQSQVRFSIDEELNRQPKTVVGVTDQVAGQMAVDLNDLSKIQVGVIQVNARTLATDSDRRDRAIRNFILNTDRFELITFTPTTITGLNGAARPGESFTFQIAGTLTIRDIARAVVFEVTVQGESATRLAGSAATIVRRSDFGLTIPNVMNVANVGEEVTLEIDFVAERES